MSEQIRSFIAFDMQNEQVLSRLAAAQKRALHVETALRFGNKVRGLRNVVCFALYSILCPVLNIETAQNIGKKTKQCHQPTSTHIIETRQRVKPHHIWKKLFPPLFCLAVLPFQDLLLWDYRRLKVVVPTTQNPKQLAQLIFFV